MACLLILIGIGILLRLVRINRSYWFDELYTMAQLGEPSFQRMLHDTTLDPNNPPLFSMIGYGWVQIFGYSEIGSRSLSLLLGILLIGTPWIARTALNQTEKWLAAAMLALWYLPIRFSQETRVYSLMLLLGAICLYCFLENMVTPTRARRVAIHISLIFLALTHVFGILLALSFLATMILLAKGVRQRTALTLYAAALAAVGSAPLLLDGILSLTGGRFWVPFTPSWLLTQAILVVTPVGAAILLYSFAMARSSGPVLEWRSPLTRALIPSLVMLVGSIVLSVHTPIIIARNLICLVPALVLIASTGLKQALHGRSATIVFALLGMLGMQSAIAEYFWVGFNREDFRAVSRLSVEKNVPMCYVVSQGESSRLTPLYGFYVDKIWRRPDLIPRLYDLDALGSEAVANNCPFWSAIHAPGFNFQSEQSFKQCVRSDPQMGLAPEVLVFCAPRSQRD